MDVYYDDTETCAVCGEDFPESDCWVIELGAVGPRIVVCGDECEEAAPFVVKSLVGAWLS